MWDLMPEDRDLPIDQPRSAIDTRLKFRLSFRCTMRGKINFRFSTLSEWG